MKEDKESDTERRIEQATEIKVEVKRKIDHLDDGGSTHL
jgi:hypothetical protein